jgi:hypothetical protein
MKTFKQFFEKTVIGLIEYIDLHGVGTVDAKIDSGNGAYNVLHGEDITRQGNKVTFTTINGKRIIKDIEDTIVINVGAGNTVSGDDVSPIDNAAIFLTCGYSFFS